MDQTVEGHGAQDLFVAEQRGAAQWGTGDGVQDVDGDGAGVEFAQLEGQLDALLLALAHAHDAAATDFHAGALGGVQGFNLVGLTVGGAQSIEVGGCGFQIAVVALHTGFTQTDELFLGGQTERSTHPNTALGLQGAYPTANLGHLTVGGFLAAGDEREAFHPLGLVVQSVLDDGILGYQSVHLGIRAVMGRLGAPFAILATTPGLGVDDGAHIKVAAGTGHGDLVRGLT